jgi:ribosome-associated protein
MNEIPFALRGDHITLDALLKATGWAPSGGAAKQLIAAGRVQVDGRVETRRGAKLRAGQRVAMDGRAVRLTAAAGAT